MNISFNVSPNFNAKFISNVYIKKFDSKNNDYIDKKVSFVELDPNNRGDLNATSDAISYWNNDFFGCNIFNSLCNLADNDIIDEKEKIYAITLQNSNFDNLIGDDIQGLADVYELDNLTELYYLQVNPDLLYTYEKPQYKHVGSAMVETLKDMYNDKAILLSSVKTAIPFYQKLGFEKYIDYDNNSKYIWNKDVLNKK